MLNHVKPPFSHGFPHLVSSQLQEDAERGGPCGGERQSTEVSALRGPALKITALQGMIITVGKDYREILIWLYRL